MNRNNSNKLSAIMIIFVTASPLGSLIRLFMLIYEYFYHDTNILNNDNNNTSLSSYLHDLFLPNIIHNNNNTNNSTSISIEQILSSIFHQYAIPINSFTTTFQSHNNNNIDITTIHHRIHQDLQMVIPWIFAFTTLIIIPLSILVCNALWRRSDMESNYRKERINVYQKCLEKFMKKLDARDVIICIDDDDKDGEIHNNNDRNDKNKNNDYNEDTFIIIPKSGIPYNPNPQSTSSTSSSSENSKIRQITGTCAICLSTYDKGDTVVWSSYIECPHVYHLHCIQTWISKTYTTSCPCCRRNFIDSGLYHKMKYECRRRF